MPISIRKTRRSYQIILNFRQILTRVHKAKADSGLMADADFGSARDELEDQTRTEGLQECPAFSGRRPCPKLHLGEPNFKSFGDNKTINECCCC